MRILSTLMIASLLALPAYATKPTPDEPAEALAGGPLVAQENTYRYGDTYHFETGTTADACAQACDTDSVCAAWSLIPATFEMELRCELKTNPGTASFRPGAISGLTQDLQMDPVSNAVMRYEIKVPESRQPAAVPLDQVRPSPVPRTFGDPLPKTMPELLGGPQTKISAVLRPEPVRVAVAPAPVIAPARQVNAVLKRQPKMVSKPTVAGVKVSAAATTVSVKLRAPRAE